MGSLTNFLELELLDHVLNAEFVPTGDLYLCLCTADPGETATGAACQEVANQYGYARTAISFGTAASRAVVQDAAVNFPQASGGGWGTASHWCITDVNTYGSGNAYAYGAFGTPQPILDGDTPSVASGEVDVTYSTGDISNYLALKLLDLAFNNVSYTKPSTYVGLVDTIVTDSDTGSSISEPSGGAYARVLVNPNSGGSPKWKLATGGLVENNDEIAFTTATADWGTMVATVICDNASTGAGNLLFYDNDTVDKPVNSGNTAKFPADSLDITKD